MELSYPVGSYPFHFVPASTSVSSGPYVGPIGASYEAICVDFTGGVVGCISHVEGFTVQ